MSGAIRTLPVMTKTLIGYARCSTDAQDLTAQRDRLRELGVAEDRIYLNHGLTRTTRNRPGLDQALAAVREGDTLVVPKLDRLARSVPDARAIGGDLAGRGIKLSLGGQVYDPADPMGKMFFNILATFAEFSVDLLRMRTREGMAVARAKGKLLRETAPELPTRASADHRYLAVILNVVFALDVPRALVRVLKRHRHARGVGVKMLRDARHEHLPPPIVSRPWQCCPARQRQDREHQLGRSPAVTPRLVGHRHGG